MATGMFSGRSVLGAQQLQRPVEPYLRQQYPEVYGALGGFMGMAPDEMSGSILDPNTARVRAGAQYGFPVGTALQVAPLAPMLAPAVKAGARALGPTAVRMGERYLQRQGLMPGVVEGGAIPGRDVITPQSKKELKSLADSFAEQIRALGFDAKVEHSGSKAGASSYINVSDPQTGRFLTKPIRISDHSKGPFESQNVINILNPKDDFPKVFEELNKMRAMGESLVFKQQKYAQSLIDDGVKPKVAYQRAKDEVKETPTSTLYPAEERMAIAQRNAALPVEQSGLGLPANKPQSALTDNEILEQFWKDLDKAGDGYIGVRADDAIVKNSFRKSWNRPDQVKTTRLPGTSVMGVGQDNITKEKLLEAIKNVRGYGKNVYLLEGKSPTDMQYLANDPGERLLSDNKILSSFFNESAEMRGGVKKGQPLFTAAPIGGIGLGAGTQDQQQNSINSFIQ